MNGFLPLGTHEYRIEEDLLFLRYSGQLTPEHAREIMSLVHTVRARWGRVLVLTDSSRGAVMPPQTRKAFMDLLTPATRMDYQAVFGMPGPMRVIAFLLTRAARLMGRSQLEIEFFATETAARAYLNAKREYLQTRAGLRSPPAEDRSLL